VPPAAILTGPATPVPVSVAPFARPRCQRPDCNVHLEVPLLTVLNRSRCYCREEQGAQAFMTKPEAGEFAMLPKVQVGAD